jgi:hypothetical protein
MPKAGNTTARGYGNLHQRRRAHWKPRVEAGLVDCARCRRPIEPGATWDLGHNDDGRTYRGPEHATCNRGAGGTNGALVVNARRRKSTVRQSRDW